MLYNISYFDFKTIVIVIVYCSKFAEGLLYVGVVCDRRETGSHGDDSCSQQSCARFDVMQGTGCTAPQIPESVL